MSSTATAATTAWSNLALVISCLMMMQQGLVEDVETIPSSSTMHTVLQYAIGLVRVGSREPGRQC